MLHRRHSFLHAFVVAVAVVCLSLVVCQSLLRSRSAARTREFDLVIFGATGYVGSLLTASLLGDRAPFLSIAPGVKLNSGVEGLRFALAGRDAVKLQQIWDQYQAKGFHVSGLKLIVADAADPASLDQLVSRTTVVLTTASQQPGADGFDANALIRRCIQHGTHLLDLDGFWLGDEALASELDAAARATGASYSPACGEVAVLPDMATYRAWASLGRPLLRSSTVHHGTIRIST